MVRGRKQPFLLPIVWYIVQRLFFFTIHTHSTKRRANHRQTGCENINARICFASQHWHSPKSMTLLNCFITLFPFSSALSGGENWWWSCTEEGKHQIDHTEEIALGGGGNGGEKWGWVCVKKGRNLHVFDTRGFCWDWEAKEREREGRKQKKKSPWRIFSRDVAFPYFVSSVKLSIIWHVWICWCNFCFTSNLCECFCCLFFFLVVHVRT